MLIEHPTCRKYNQIGSFKGVDKHSSNGSCVVPQVNEGRNKNKVKPMRKSHDKPIGKSHAASMSTHTKDLNRGVSILKLNPPQCNTKNNSGKITPDGRSESSWSIPPVSRPNSRKDAKEKV
ncbi:hypothetical protein RJT34_06648 [Clitoria ternatea]|uniref:Uncharacterized protein n=1 Tax=Clitoria ternatea TaxID=43366 RepID=A0AAN9K2I2_CLITE